jgi:hypothetical protein
VISRQAATLSAAALGLVVALAGCSSSASTSNAASSGSATPAASAAASSGSAANAGLSDSALLTAFKTAANGATAVHVKGSLKDGTDTISLDLQLNKTAKTAQGTIGAQGATIPIISVGGVDYFQFTDSVIKMAGASSLGSAIKDKWVSSSSTIGQGMDSGFKTLVSYDDFIGSITADDSGSLTGSTPSGTTTYNGQTVAVYKADDGTVAYFAATGPAYLLEIQNASSSDAGALVFTWNQPTTVAAPPASQIYKG